MWRSRCAMSFVDFYEPNPDLSSYLLTVITCSVEISRWRMYFYFQGKYILVLAEPMNSTVGDSVYHRSGGVMDRSTVHQMAKMNKIVVSYFSSAEKMQHKMAKT